MNTAMVIIISTFTAVLGFIFSRVLDTRHMRYQQEVYEELVEKMNIKLMESNQRELRLIKALNELQMQKAGIKFQDIAKKLYNTKETAKEADESIKIFFDLSQTLPDDNGIDFGGF